MMLIISLKISFFILLFKVNDDSFINRKSSKTFYYKLKDC
uniref:Uncharacterized protein n=1 Tax=Siphoviridae sp. ctBAZ2 TaxID=2827801 RepID=A0A8S5S8C9_9CAUD|nr:MAG TPA: hypothetical protein [Siphoviridae sp. ctBAZ2]